MLPQLDPTHLYAHTMSAFLGYPVLALQECSHDYPKPQNPRKTRSTARCSIRGFPFKFLQARCKTNRQHLKAVRQNLLEQALSGLGRRPHQLHVFSSHEGLRCVLLSGQGYDNFRLGVSKSSNPNVANRNCEYAHLVHGVLNTTDMPRISKPCGLGGEICFVPTQGTTILK